METRVPQPLSLAVRQRTQEPAPSWAARLAEHRAGTFVGRTAELELLRHALTARHPRFQVLSIHGPPGAGKTTLLHRFATECVRAGVAYRLLDAGSIQPLPKPFSRVLRSTLHLADDEPLTPALARRGRFILMMDNFHKLYRLHDWLCETVLPQLPASTVVIVASRGPMPDLWRTDPAWRRLVHSVSLDGFSPEESRAYLTLRAVPEDMQERFIRFSRGHPLALSLAADLYEQRSELSFDPFSAPDVVQTLARRFAGDVVDPDRRAALEAAAVLRVTSEAVLAVMLDKDDVRAEFEWLCQLSFVEFAPTGVYLHDLVRDTLSRDLLWRNPHRYEQLRQRAHDFYAPLLRHPGEVVQQEALADYLFLYRRHDALRPFFEVPVLPKTEPAKATDYPRMLELVQHYEGQESGRTLVHWLHHQPESAWVIRGDDGQSAAFCLIVRLDRRTESRARADPLTRAIWDYLERNNLLGSSDVATVTRFVVDAETYQDVSPRIASMALTLLRHCLAVPNLKFTFNIMARPEVWEPFARASGFFQPVRELQFVVGGRRMGVFMQDWRWETPAMWLARIAPEHREGQGQAGLGVPGARSKGGTEPRLGDAPAEVGVVGDEELLNQRQAFAGAVRHALKNFHVPDALADNPLVDSALVLKATGARATSDRKARALQAAITEVVEFLGTVPKREKLYQALRYTYLEPQGSQEKVAEWLDLPFSTYRGHLRVGIGVLTDILWRKDTEARMEVRGEAHMETRR